MVVQTKKKNRIISSPIINIGMDLHKDKWVICIYEGFVYEKTFSIRDDINELISYLRKHYPGQEIRSAYEAGFCGFWVKRHLESAGIKCIVVHAADIATADFERRRKSDKVDSRKIAHELSRGSLKGIYVSDEESEQIRELVRTRMSMSKDKRGQMCRIRAYLHRHGLSLGNELGSKTGPTSL